MTDDELVRNKAQELLKRDIEEVLKGIKPESDKITVNGDVNLNGERFIWKIEMHKREKGNYIAGTDFVAEEIK